MKKKQENLFFFTIQYICVLFWGIPEIIQKPFKILLLLYLFYLSLSSIKKTKDYWLGLICPLIGIVLLVNSILHSCFQTSTINIALSFFCIPLVNKFAIPFSEKQFIKARKIGLFLCFCMFLQLCFFRSNDGRPNLGYEINWSAAYLFIFFIYSDYIKFKFGKIFVCVASFLLLSRLLILSLLVYFFSCYVLRKFKLKPRLNLYFIEIITFISFFAFNVFFLINVEKGENYDTSINRLSSVNDGSNMLRFTVNIKIIDGIFIDHNLKYGYGQIATSNNTNLYKDYIKRYFIMPHNELLDTIAEFGYIFTIYVWLLSTYYYSKVFKYFNYPYIIPILIYTLILWVRFLIVPSIEMFFLLTLLTLRKDEYFTNRISCK